MKIIIIFLIFTVPGLLTIWILWWVLTKRQPGKLRVVRRAKPSGDGYGYVIQYRTYYGLWFDYNKKLYDSEKEAKEWIGDILKRDKAKTTKDKILETFEL